MKNKNFFNFLILLVFTHRAKHLAIFLISIILVALISAVFFITGSIKKDLLTTLDSQADFVLQRYEAGKVLNTPTKWVDQFTEIHGVSNSQGRVYGMHFYEPSQEYFMIVGLDFFDTQTLKTLQTLVDNVDIDKLLSKNYMIIGKGVKALFDYYQYRGSYTFRPPDRSKVKVYFYDLLPDGTELITNNLIIMDIDLARKILGLPNGYVTDIALEVPNKFEIQTIRTKLIISHFNMRIIEKNDIKRYYTNLFNYKSGVFLILYLVVLVTFFLILYQRYSMISNTDSKEIALLRLVGWRINEVIWLKIGENFIVVFLAYLIGVIFAYLYVFYLDAPLLRDIFLGKDNLNYSINFIPNIDIETLGLLFLLFVIPFILTILVPVWKLAITEPTEVMR